jgi:hypothetical protein
MRVGVERLPGLAFGERDMMDGADLGRHRFDAAKPCARRIDPLFLEMKVADADLADLGRRFGAGRFEVDDADDRHTNISCDKAFGGDQPRVRRHRLVIGGQLLRQPRLELGGGVDDGVLDAGSAWTRTTAMGRPPL